MYFILLICCYFDFLVYCVIKVVLQGKKYKLVMKWVGFGEYCLMIECCVDDVMRDVEVWLKCFYMRDHFGSVFIGMVLLVMNFGLFVLLDGNPESLEPNMRSSLEL